MKKAKSLLAITTLMLGLHAIAAQANPVINQILFNETVYGGLQAPLFGVPSQFILDDGSSLAVQPHWYSRPFGGSTEELSTKLTQVKVENGNIHYTFDKPQAYPASGGRDLIDQLAFYLITEHDGPYSVSGRFEAYSPLVLIAEEGSTKATMSGYAKLVENNNVHYDGAWYDEHEIDFAAPIGSLVYYELEFNITWWHYEANKQAFTTDFFEPVSDWDQRYPELTITGKIDFTNILSPVPEPSTYAMLGLGLGVMGFAARRRKSA